MFNTFNSNVTKAGEALATFAALTAEINDQLRKLEAQQKDLADVEQKLDDATAAGGDAETLRKTADERRDEVAATSANLRVLRRGALKVAESMPDIWDRLAEGLPQYEHDLIENFRSEWVAEMSKLSDLLSRRAALERIFGAPKVAVTDPIPPSLSLAEASAPHAVLPQLASLIGRLRVDGVLCDLLAAGCAPPDGTAERVERIQSDFEGARSRNYQRSVKAREAK